MLPTLTDVHIDYALTNMALKWAQDATAFVATQNFLPIGVDHATNKYFTYNREDFWRDPGDDMTLLAAGAPVKRGGYRMSNDSYSCDVRAYGKPVTLEVERNADGGINSEKDAIDFVMSVLSVRRENHWMAQYFTTGKWTTDLTPANLWSNFATSDPKADFEVARLKIQSTTGKTPNTFTVGARVHSQLIQHPIIKDQFKYTSDQSLDADMLKRYFGVERYLVASAVNTTSKENAAAITFDYIAGKHALLSYSGPVSMESATAGRTFAWNGYGNDAGIAIGSYYENQTRSNIIEGFMAYDFKVVAADLGYFFNGAVA